MTLDIARLPTEEIVALIVATGFAAGLNVYASALTIGVLAQTGAITLPAPLELLASWWVIGACAALFALEFVADKIPVFDLIWNTLQTFVRVPAGALLGFGAATHLSPTQQLLAAALGGLIAFAAHAGKTAARAAVTPSPEPFSNIALSLGEDAAAIGLTWFATTHPYMAASIAIAALAMTLLLIRIVVRALRRMFATTPTR